MSEAKELRKREYANRKEQGAHARKGKDVEPLNRTEGGTPRHSGRNVPPAIKLSDAKILGGKLAKRDE